MSKTSLDWTSLGDAYTSNPSMFEDLLKNSSKKDILLGINMNSPANRLELLFQSLDKRTLPGARFWRQEGLFPCDINSGHLKEICALVETELNDRLAADKISDLEKFHLYYKLGFIYHLKGKPDLALKQYTIAKSYMSDTLDSSQRFDYYAALAQSGSASGKEWLWDTLWSYKQAFIEWNSVNAIYQKDLLFNYNTLLSSNSKKDLFNAILEEKNEGKKLVLFNEAIDPETPLGKRFWQKEGFFACSLKNGYLAKICEEMEKIYTSKGPNHDLQMAGKLYTAQGKLDLATQVYNDSEISNHYNVILARAKVNDQAGRFLAAVQDYESLLKVHHDNSDHHLIIAKAYGKLYESHSGFFQHSHLSLIKAIHHYMKAIECAGTTLLFQESQKAFTEFLQAHSKKTLFAAIKDSHELFPQLKISTDDATNPMNPLGVRFWQQEGIIPCRLEAGTLKQLNNLNKAHPVTAASTIPATVPKVILDDRDIMTSESESDSDSNKIFFSKIYSMSD